MQTPIKQTGSGGTMLLPVLRGWLLFLGFSVLIWLQGCSPVPTRPAPLAPVPPAVRPPPPPVASLPKPQEAPTRPSVEESRITEENLKEKVPAPQLKSKGPPPRPSPGREVPPPPPEDSSLIAKITPGTAPRRAASLRLTEEGKRLLDSGDYAKALSRLEKTIAVDSTNPYGYYYLAKAHYHMGRYRESLNFLDVAESLVAREPYWLAEVYALKGENLRALGSFERAYSSYSQALRLNPNNRVAVEGVNRGTEEAPSPQR